MAEEMDRPLGSRYRLGRLLGSGATGKVYLGVDSDGAEFACKVLHPELTANQAVVNRFVQERAILVSLRHPHLVGVHDLVAEGDTLAIVMDLVPGGDLRSTLAGAGTLLPAEVARIGAGIAAALAAIHGAGVVHRDIKPENVLMDDSTVPSRPRVTDLGVSRLLDQATTSRSTMLVGTPQYMAPELSDGGDPTAASDLYALGIMLYEMSCGVTPFVGGPVMAVLRQHAEMWPGRPSGIPDPMWDLINWLLAKSPRARPESAGQVAEILTTLATDLRSVPLATRLSEPPPPVPTSQQQTTQGVPGWGAGPATPAAPAGTAVREPLGSGGLASPGAVGALGPFPLTGLGGLAGIAPAPTGKPGRVKRRVAALLVVLLVLGLVGWLGTRHNTSRQAQDTPAPPPGTTSTTAPPVSASPSDTVTTTDSAAAATPAQLAEAPNLVGQSYENALRLVPAGITLESVDTVDEKAGDGTILSQDPKAGAPVNGTIKVTVARPAVVTYLDSLQPASGGWTNLDTAALSGRTYAHALVSDEQRYCPGYGYGGTVEYNLAQGYRRMVGTLGLDASGGDSTIKMQVEVFVDDHPTARFMVGFYKPVQLNLSVAGGLRLRIQWQATAGACDGYDRLAIGEARLLGLPSEVPQPTDTSTESTTG